MRLGRAVLLSGHFLFFLYAFHAAISIRYWFAIDIAIRYRYRSYRAFSIASSDIDSDSDSDRTTATGCGSAALCYFADGDVSSLPRETKDRLVRAVDAVDLSRLPVLEPVRPWITDETIATR
uniref:Uncharacterized protein n=1 Tax=Candidatus Kentrum sp. FM TaxID=2126340 RepID=A0A450X6Q5_9GAMM|nr:MAG: hypothetical protein BECKFM1743B_GA0114221_110283 [Candidatus Kentron sp. FM]